MSSVALGTKPSVLTMVSTGTLKASHRRTKREALATQLCTGLAGGHNTHSVAADGCECGVDVLAKACVQLHSAVLVDQGSGSLLGGSTGAQNAGGLLELEDGGAGQVVGGQQTHDVGSFSAASSALAARWQPHQPWQQLGSACAGDLVALGGGGERSGEEQLSILSHDAHVSIGSAQCAGAAAHAVTTAIWGMTPETWRWWRSAWRWRSERPDPQPA